MVKAWRVIFEDISAIASAETRNKAHSDTLKSLRDSGWAAEWLDITVRRAPEFDSWAAASPGRCIGEEYALMEIRSATVTAPSPEAE
jgi:hypothetical protein